MQGDESISLRVLRARLAKAEEDIGRLRGALRGVLYKLSRGSIDTAIEIIERVLHKSLKNYPHPIDGEPDDPTEVKR